MFFVEDPQVNLYLMISCLTVNAMLNLEEFRIFTKYKYRVQSKINIINILIFYLYFYVRVFVFSEQTGSPLSNYGPGTDGFKDLKKIKLRDQVLF